MYTGIGACLPSNTERENNMFPTRRKLKLRIQTVRQLTSQESAEALGGAGTARTCQQTTCRSLCWVCSETIAVREDDPRQYLTEEI